MLKDRKTLLFGVGLLVGVAAGAVGMMSLRGGDGPYASSPAPATKSMGAASASTAFITAVAGNCEMTPVLPNGSDGDGRESLQAKPGDGSATEVASLLLSGKEAAAAGRQRDAEIDFLNACRNAAALKEGDPIPLADAMYQLARHYANVGALGGGKGKDLYQRAERLYSASLEAYRARYGEGHEKTRFAQEGLITVQHATGGKAPTAIAKAPPAPAAAPVEAPAAAAPVAPAPIAAVPTPAAPAPAAVVAAQPTPAAQAGAKAEAPRAAASQARVARKPRIEEPPQQESTAVVEPRRTEPAPRSETPRAERRVDPEPQAAVVEEARPRAQPRRAAPREDSYDDGQAASGPDTSSSGSGGSIPQAEGSPTAP